MSDCTQDKEPPYAESHVRWCERSENESRRKTTSFSSYSICCAALAMLNGGLPATVALLS